MNKNRALLLDRDGVINADKGYVGTIEQFQFLPGLFPFLRAVRDQGYRLAILTNQSGVARGHYSTDDYAKLTAHMLKELRQERIDIELTLACFMHPEVAHSDFGQESFWRKPNPGMVLEAIRRLDLDPDRSAFLGDNLRDMQAAQQGHIGRCLWLTRETSESSSGIVRVENFDDALKALSV